MIPMVHISLSQTATNVEEAEQSNDVPISLVVTNVLLAHSDPVLARTLWKVECRGGQVARVAALSQPEMLSTQQWDQIDGKGSLMLPSLCHPHVHLDKCFVLDKCGELTSGDFNEAMLVTNNVKTTFPLDMEDLYERGARLIRQSMLYGVTSMRAHVEADTTVNLTCVDIALKLRRQFRTQCDVRVSVFAQEPLFDTPGHVETGQNFEILCLALQRDEVTVIGSAPYVEATIEQAKQNIALIFDLALSIGLHVDFHLDYNLNPDSEPLIYEVIQQAQKYLTLWKEYDRRRVRQPRITIGHATRLQLFTSEEWQNLLDAIDGLPITFVGLPQSDLYMQGRGEVDKPLGAPRGTLRVPQLARQHNLQIAMGVNNVDNAFTPQGSLDPLSLCTLGVAVFQTATTQDIRTLVESVTLTSRLAIGQERLAMDLFPNKGDLADFVILHGTTSLRAAALNPSIERTTIRLGRVVAQRRTREWLSVRENRGDKHPGWPFGSGGAGGGGGEVNEVKEGGQEDVLRSSSSSMPRGHSGLIVAPWYQRVRWRYLFFPPLLMYHWALSLWRGRPGLPT